MEDITPSLLNQILKDFHNSIKSNAKLNHLQKKVEDEKATYVDVNEYASIISSCMKNAFSKYMKSENLPDGRCYYNIAERIVSATEHEQYELIADFAENVQALLNKKAQIGLKAQRASEDKEAVKSLSNVASNAREYDHVAKSVSQSVERMGKNIVDRSVQQNAEFQVKAGLNPKIIRKTDGNCCEWCSRIAGIYDYPNNVPKEIYRRHNNCSCTVEYDPGSGRRQNIWNKQWRDETESDRINNNKVNSKLENDDKAIKEYRKHFGEYGLQYSESKALIDYSSSYAYTINDKLRRGQSLTKEEKAYVLSLDNALKKIPVYSGDLSRSLYFYSDEDIENYVKQFVVGKEKVSLQYLSTTKGSDLYNPDGQVQIYITNSKKGHDISLINSNESEVLFERNSKYIILNKIYKDGKWYILLSEV